MEYDPPMVKSLPRSVRFLKNLSDMGWIACAQMHFDLTTYQFCIIMLVR